MQKKVLNIIGKFLVCMMSFSFWISVTYPCILFLGEYPYPLEKDYN